MRGWTVAVFLMGTLATPASALDVWETPYPGVMHLQRTTDTPWSIQAVLIDLCAPGVRVRASRYDERGQATSTFATEVGAAVAVNGDFFRSGADYGTSGLAVGDGEPWPNDPPDDRWMLTAFGLERSELVAPMTALEPWMSESVGGVPQLVVGGVPIDDFFGWTFCTVRHPRTALGLSEDRRTLILVTVDGRSSQSVGMTCPEVAALMEELGANDAVNLDGGGSTAMVIGGAVVNRPSDGSERIVGNHLGVVVDGSTGVDACPDRGEPPPSGPIELGPRARVDLGANEDGDADGGCGCGASGGGSALAWLVALTILERRRR